VCVLIDAVNATVLRKHVHKIIPVFWTPSTLIQFDPDVPKKISHCEFRENWRSKSHVTYGRKSV